MTTQANGANPIGETIGAALDYIQAVLTGLPAYAETVAEAYGPGRISRGLSTLVVLLVMDAAKQTGHEPDEIIRTMRQTYGGN